MNLPFFRTDYHFWMDEPDRQFVVVRAYTQAATASEARVVGRPAALAAANVEGAKVEYLLGTTVPVPGVTAAKAPHLRKTAPERFGSARLEKA